MSEQGNDNVERGAGWACASIDALGEGPGFRKIRGPLGVTAFGVNAIVLPPAYATGSHYHDEQEELYFLHSGRVAIEFGDGASQGREPGGPARVAAPAPRRLRNLSDTEEAFYVIVGGKDGDVGRDGKLAEGET